MNFSVNPSALMGLNFSVPIAVTDKHLKLAGAAQIKVLLWLLRHCAENPSTEEMCKALNMKSADATDAMQYWVECGIVLEENASESAPSAQPQVEQTPLPSPAVQASTEPKELEKIVITKPTSEQIMKRAKESAEIRFMFNEAQQKLGRTIGYDSQATLLMIHDSYGLPVEVLLMLIEYCVSIGKSSIGYIAKVAKDWGEREIDTLEKADEQIQGLRRCEGLWKRFCELTGIRTPRPTASQSAYLRKWNSEYGFGIELIYSAYEEMANHTDRISFQYMNKILQNWYESGYKTAEDIENGKAQRLMQKQGKSKPAASQGYEASYDIDEYDRRSMTQPLIYKKDNN